MYLGLLSVTGLSLLREDGSFQRPHLRCLCEVLLQRGLREDDEVIHVSLTSQSGHLLCACFPAECYFGTNLLAICEKQGDKVLTYPLATSHCFGFYQGQERLTSIVIPEKFCQKMGEAFHTGSTPEQVQAWLHSDGFREWAAEYRRPQLFLHSS